MHRHLTQAGLGILLASASSIFPWPYSSHAQATGLASPACYTNLRRFKLISPSVGWAIVDLPSDQHADGGECTRRHLYWTETNGRTWREITPTDMPTRSMGQVFFLDRQHGWMFSTDALSEEKDARFYLLSTEDGGKNWRTLVLQRPMFKLMDDYTFPSQLFFSDSQHGWILWHWHLMNSSANALLATSDGGRTWSRLPDPPGPGPFQFTSPREGWIIGGPEIPDGIPDPESENLWATHDGGIHWQVVSVHLPAGTEGGEAYFSAFRFKNSREGLAVAERQLSGRLFRFFTCFTRDGGKSCKVLHFDAYHASPSFVGEHIIWSVSDWPAMKVTIQTDGHATSPTPPPGLSPEGRFDDFDFIDDSNGWVRFDRELLSTSDGGITLQIITPPSLAQSPFPPPQLFAVGWDHSAISTDAADATRVSHSSAGSGAGNGATSPFWARRRWPNANHRHRISLRKQCMARRTQCAGCQQRRQTLVAHRAAGPAS
jgi:photosystem II stability/assembly factor-like uncharacterized protein